MSLSLAGTDPAVAAHDVLLPAPLDEGAADVAIVGSHGLSHVPYRQVACQQLVHVEPHLVLLHVTSERKDTGHVRDRPKARLDEPVLS